MGTNQSLFPGIVSGGIGSTSPAVAEPNLHCNEEKGHIRG